MWHRLSTKLICAVLLYFALLGLMALTTELYNVTPQWEILMLFPAGKFVGDIVFALSKRVRDGLFWEDWFGESVRFALLGLVALLAAELWKNVFGLPSYPDITLVAVVSYVVLDWLRKGAYTEAHELH